MKEKTLLKYLMFLLIFVAFINITYSQVNKSHEIGRLWMTMFPVGSMADYAPLQNQMTYPGGDFQFQTHKNMERLGLWVGVKNWANKFGEHKSFYVAEGGYLNFEAPGYLYPLKYYLGNTEEMHSIAVNVDSTPPETIIEFGVPYYEAAEGNIWITSSTPVHFLAVDYPACASGIRATYYRVWYGGSWSRWTLYDENLSLEGEGKHYVEFHSVDNVGNIEEVHNQTCHHNGSKTPCFTIHPIHKIEGIDKK